MESLRKDAFDPGLPPPWRKGGGRNLESCPPFAEGEAERSYVRGRKFVPKQDQVLAVKAALILRRPLLLLGKPGTGKSTLPYWVAEQRELGPVLHWQITSRSNLKDGLYQYDALSRMQETQRGTSADADDVGRFIQLGPLGTALLPQDSGKPRVLIIDEFDKSSVDLPSDLLHVLELGEFEIPELSRISTGSAVRVRTYDAVDEKKPDCGWAWVRNGRVQCSEFPFIVITSNEERQFPGAFLRRCLRLTLSPPEREELLRIAELHFRDEHELAEKIDPVVERVVDDFLTERDGVAPGAPSRDLATDQLLNALRLRAQGIDLAADEYRELRPVIFKSIREGGA